MATSKKKISLAVELSAADKASVAKFEPFAKAFAKGDASANFSGRDAAEIIKQASDPARDAIRARLKLDYRCAYIKTTPQVLGKLLANKGAALSDAQKALLVQADGAERAKWAWLLKAAGLVTKSAKGGARANNGGKVKAAAKAAATSAAASKDPIPLQKVSVPRAQTVENVGVFAHEIAALMAKFMAKNAGAKFGDYRAPMEAFVTAIKDLYPARG